MHRLVYRGRPLNGYLQARPDAGLLDVSFDGKDGDGLRLRLQTIHGSDGLSLALAAILNAGCSIVSCETDVMAFDEIFFSIIGADAAVRNAGAPV